MVKGWTESSSGVSEYEADDGSRMRVLAPGSDSVHPTWHRVERLRDGRWEVDRHGLDGAADARKYVEDISRHRADAKTFGRLDLRMAKPVATPWGVANAARRFGHGVVYYTTHGYEAGFLLDHARNLRVHDAWRSDAAWYGRDHCWAIVTHTFPELFTSYERKEAEDILKNWLPHAYMRATGATIETGESWCLLLEHHLHVHKHDWVAISAIRPTPETVIVTATIGGVRNSDATFFKVPATEYDAGGGLPFVVDPARHEEANVVRYPKP